MHLSRIHSFCSWKLTNCLHLPKFSQTKRPLQRLPRHYYGLLSPLEAALILHFVSISCGLEWGGDTAFIYLVSIHLGFVFSKMDSTPFFPCQLTVEINVGSYFRTDWVFSLQDDFRRGGRYTATRSISYTPSSSAFLQMARRGPGERAAPSPEQGNLWQDTQW